MQTECEKQQKPNPKDENQSRRLALRKMCGKYWQEGQEE